MSKSLVWLGMGIGSTAGAYIPLLWGAGLLSLSSMIFSAIGGIIGIFIGFKLSEDF